MGDLRLLQLVCLAGLAVAWPGAARANDLNQLISQFSPDLPNWHEYNFSHDLCSQTENPKCTKELVKAAVLRNVMPCQDPNHKVQDQDLLLPRDPNTGCLYSPGHVIIGKYDDVGVMAISILTHTDHRLYRGVVLRYVEQENGVFRIRTRGIGNNRSKLWAAANKQLGKIIFNNQDKRIKDFLKTCLANPHSGCE